MVVELARIFDAALELRRNVLPGEALRYLDDWLEALALPFSVDPEEAAARAAEKMRGRRSYALAAWIETVERHGFEFLCIERVAPFEVGISAVSQPVSGDAWAHTIEVVVGAFEFTAEQLAALRDELAARHARAHGHVMVRGVLTGA